MCLGFQITIYDIKKFFAITNVIFRQMYLKHNQRNGPSISVS